MTPTDSSNSALSTSGNPRRVLILGGGFTGLRAAWLLHRLGHQVTVVERGEKLGGMVGTFEHVSGGRRFLFDYGPHLFFKEYLKEYRELIGDDLLTLTDRFTMCTTDAVLSYPLRPVEMLSKMNPLKSAGYVLDYLWGKLGSHPGDPSSLADSLSQRFGRKLFNDFYAPYIQKCCGLPVEETDIEWARERENVSGRSLASNLVNKLRGALSKAAQARLRSTNDPAAAEITAWYPRLGSGQLCDAMSASLGDTTVYLRSNLETVALENGRVRSVEISRDGERLTLEADVVVSTLPLPHLAAAIQPLEAEIRDAAARLRFRAVRLVNLIVAKPRALDSLELFSMDPGHLFKRVYEPKAMSAEMAPPEMTSLCLEVCCTEGDAVSKMQESEIIDSCIESLCKLRVLESKKQVTDAFVVNLPSAYPVYAKGFQAGRHLVLERIARIPNLVTCGRQGLFRYHSMTNEVMETADSIVRFLESAADKTGADNRRSQWGRSFY